MENKEHQIIKYLKYVETKLKAQLDSPEFDATIKSSLSSRIESVVDLSERISFQLKSPDEKQAFRIEWIASLRKRQMPIDSKLSTIQLYDKIRETLPYLILLNRNGTVGNLVNLCYEELELIDFSGRNFGDNHISFASAKPHFEKIFQSEEVLSIHPEAVSKLRELYQAFETTLKK